MTVTNYRVAIVGAGARQVYGLMPGSWVLVRPDGYVGAIISAENIGALEDYLQRVGLERRVVSIAYHSDNRRDCA